MGGALCLCWNKRQHPLLVLCLDLAFFAPSLDSWPIRAELPHRAAAAYRTGGHEQKVKISEHFIQNKLN